MSTTVDVTKELIETIQAATMVQTIKAEDGREFYSHALHSPEKPVTPNHFAFTSLESLLDFAASVKDDSVLKFAHIVVSEASVTGFGAVSNDRFKQRTHLASAVAPKVSYHSFSTDRFVSHENFLIGSRIVFLQSAERDNLLRIISTVKRSNVTDMSDDGFAQEVVATNKVGTVGNERLPTEVVLREWRTFPEVEQPECTYLVRAKAGNESELPTFALFEVDGGQWKIQARKSIADYLKAGLKARGLEIPVLS
jgi:hypothetical protein